MHNSVERNQLDANFQRDLPKTRDELETDFVLTGAIVTEGVDINYLSFIHLRIVPFTPDTKREELGSAINYDEVD
jgi:hypothetical protein